MWYLIFFLYLVATLAAFRAILLSRDEPEHMMAWVLAVILVPFFGPALYTLLSQPRIAARARRRYNRKRYRQSNGGGMDTASDEGQMSAVPEKWQTVARTIHTYMGLPVRTGNVVSIISSPDATHACLIEEIKSAQTSIRLMFYIWSDDATGTEMRDAVIAACQRGVECHVLLDGVGCLATPKPFFLEIAEAGGNVAYFMPVRPSGFRWRPHLRNHRKIAVFDMSRAVIGSQNISDEQRGHGIIQPFHQTQAYLEGPIAYDLADTFRKDWNAFSRDRIPRAPTSVSPEVMGVSTQLVATGPMLPDDAVQRILLEAIYTARRDIWIATPYFVPPASLRLGLAQAALRGVCVTVGLPSRCDHPVVLAAGRSYYAELLRDDIRIVEFGEGMVHSKLIVIDDAWSLVGSLNMDRRSFCLNFESAVAIYDPAVAVRVRETIESYVDDSVRIMLRDVDRWPAMRRIGQGFTRLLSPHL